MDPIEQTCDELSGVGMQALKNIQSQDGNSDHHDIAEDHAVVKDIVLPVKPEEPLESDCCGSGCTPCVYDIYDQEVALWEKECQRLLSGTLDVPVIQDNSISSTEYTAFQISSVKQVSCDSYLFKFTIPNQGTLGLKAGQHLILRWRSSSHTITRQYTPVTGPDAVGYFEVLIKIYAEGQMSQYVKEWKLGDLVEWRGPFGSFTYTPNMYRRVVMLAAGTGIAPMVQVATQILENDEDETRIRLLYACRSYSDILLKPRLDAWCDFWNFSVLYILSQEVERTMKNRRYGDEVHFGRLDQGVLRRELGTNLESTLVLVCGTQSFDTDMISNVKELGLDEENYFKF